MANIFMVLWACCTCVVEVSDLPSRAASITVIIVVQQVRFIFLRHLSYPAFEVTIW